MSEEDYVWLEAMDRTRRRLPTESISFDEADIRFKGKTYRLTDREAEDGRSIFREH